ncbi:MAG: tRNA lysidine(34) synthetase TilS [Thiothrix sp.]|uniref:tRNA lysidine(34) synthetase TilS n=1 Tax=Thiothrix sp. TaxID=1032 RepID=UPI0026198974|nr:tRNA lysidine(34) synthetase TilS [Thiothrix sp.]MDD5393873.1 tRNA lysidine(34) synthetase TilS [Thiothrix sp.]
MLRAPTDALSAFLNKHPATGYLIAFSGGLDSHVLLHACATLQVAFPRLPFRALHIDHGLQSMSAEWAEHCRAVCVALNMPFACECLHLQIPAGESLEAVARHARYAAFSQHLQAGEILLTAHHQDDQAETLLLHLLRGSGVDGLAAMPEIRPFAQGWLGRPLLSFSREELVEYARNHALDCLQDPSNVDTRFDRNFLRQQVIPLLQQRWPVVGKTLARAARLQGESRALLASFLPEKLAQVAGSRSGTLSVRQLKTLDIPLQKALLREWLAQQHFPMPEEKKLLHVLHDVLHAKPDAEPCVAWAGCEIRRFRDDVYTMLPLQHHDPAQVLAWDVSQELAIPILHCILQPAQLGAWLAYVQAQHVPVTVRFRQGGESMYIPYRGGHHSLKHIFQERGVPSWERSRLPLIYVGERLVSIPGVLHVEPSALEC